MYSDSRELVDLQEDQETARAEYTEATDLFEGVDIPQSAREMLMATFNWSVDDEAEYQNTLRINEEGESLCSDWGDGVQLVPEDEFAEFVQELVSAIGDMPKEIPTYIVIDWEATAANIKVDYSEIVIDNDTYLVRSW